MTKTISSDNSLVILVDENDHETGLMPKMEAHLKGLLHRAVSVFILNSDGEWLIQQRALDKYHSAGLWSNTCCTHPFPAEPIEQAALRRVQEEMGLKPDRLTWLFSFTYRAELENGLTEHEYDHVLMGVSDQFPDINPHEVESYRYISFKTLHAEVVQHPERFTHWFREIYQQVQFHINKTGVIS